MAATNWDFKHSVVRILVDGKSNGTGFLVMANVVLTCAHVVTDKKDKPLGEIEVECYRTHEKCAATIDSDHFDSQTKDDVAVLILDKEHVPPSLEISLLGHSDVAQRSECESFGFPEIGDTNGYPALAEIVGQTNRKSGGELIVVESGQFTTGHSGAPVYCSETNRVIGMICEIVKPDKHGKNQKSAHVTPSEVLQRVFPELVLESKADIDEHRSAEKRLIVGATDAIKKSDAVVTYFAERLRIDLKKVAEDSQAEKVIDAMVADKLNEIITYFVDGHARFNRDEDKTAVAVIRDAAQFIFPRIYSPDQLRKIRLQLANGGYVILPATTKTIIELLQAGVDGRRAMFKDTNSAEPDGIYLVEPLGQQGIEAKKVREQFEDNLITALGIRPQSFKGAPHRSVYIKRTIARKLGSENPFRLYYVHKVTDADEEQGDYMRILNELSHEYADVLFIKQIQEDNSEFEYDIVQELGEMFVGKGE